MLRVCGSMSGSHGPPVVNPPSGDRVPLHRRASAVTAGAVERRIGQHGGVGVDHPDLLAGVEHRDAAQREEQERRGPRPLGSPAGGVTRLVVVADREGRQRCRRMERLRALDGQRQLPMLPGRQQQLEVEGEVELSVGAAAEVAASSSTGRYASPTSTRPGNSAVTRRRCRMTSWTSGRFMLHSGSWSPPIVSPGIGPGRRNGGLSRSRSSLIATGSRRRGSRRRRERARSASPPRSPPPPPGCASSGPAAPGRTSGGSTARSPRPTPRPSRRRSRPSSTAARRPGAGSAQMYQSRFGFARDERDSTNHG